jgi:hypothetical protein
MDAFLRAGKGAEKTAHAVIGVSDVDLPVKDAENVHRTDLEARAAMDTLVVVNSLD